MPKSIELTPFQKHVQRWENCVKCSLHKERHKVVIMRGKIPADVLFIAEAPGDSEDVIGVPMIGPAGKMLDKIIKQSVPEDVSYAITNVVCCYPKEQKKTEDHRPPPEAITACSPRLKEFVRLVKPQLVVLVGDVAEKNVPVLDKEYEGCHIVKIYHPAFIMKNEVVVRPLMVKKCIAQIRAGVEKLLPF